MARSKGRSRAARSGGRPSAGRKSNGRFSAGGVILLSLVVFYLPPGPQQAIGHAVRQSVLWPFIQMHVALTEFRTQARDYGVLRAQMDSAMEVLASHRTLAEENRSLRAQLAVPGQPRVRFRSAAVTRTGTAGAESSFRLSAGGRDGVETFSAVVTDAGLLGQVQEVRPGYSVGIDWSHPDFRVAAMSLDGTEHGLIQAERGEHREQDRLLLNGLAFLSDLEPGEEIVTSGRGGAYPRGIRIGWVLELAETSAGWSRSYRVNPAVHPAEAVYASIVLSVGEDEPLPDSAGATP